MEYGIILQKIWKGFCLRVTPEYYGNEDTGALPQFETKGPAIRAENSHLSLLSKPHTVPVAAIL
jgi:hypothetical protein